MDNGEPRARKAHRAFCLKTLYEENLITAAQYDKLMQM